MNIKAVSTWLAGIWHVGDLKTSVMDLAIEMKSRQTEQLGPGARLWEISCNSSVIQSFICNSVIENMVDWGSMNQWANGT